MDGTVVCWGRDYPSPDTASSPSNSGDDAVLSVGVGAAGICTVRVDSALICGQAGPVIGTGFAAVSVGDEAYCALRESGGVECWDNRGSDQTASGRIRIDAVTPSGSDFVSISVGIRHACGRRQDNTVACWGDNYDYYGYCEADQYGMPLCGFEAQGDYIGQAESPAGEFIAVSAGAFHNCALRPNGSAECWGRNFSGQATPPPTAFVAISAGHSHTCGLQADGEVQCWGGVSIGPAQDVESGADFVRAVPPGPFATISAGEGYTCGVRTNSVIKCWGRIAR